jgi:hypothetical protein
VHPPDVLLAEERFGEENEFVFDVRQSKVHHFEKVLREKPLIYEITPR